MHSPQSRPLRSSRFPKYGSDLFFSVVASLLSRDTRNLRRNVTAAPFKIKIASDSIGPRCCVSGTWYKQYNKTLFKFPKQVYLTFCPFCHCDSPSGGFRFLSFCEILSWLYLTMTAARLYFVRTFGLFHPQRSQRFEIADQWESSLRKQTTFPDATTGFPVKPRNLRHTDNASLPRLG